MIYIYTYHISAKQSHESTPRIIHDVIQSDSCWFDMVLLYLVWHLTLLAESMWDPRARPAPERVLLVDCNNVRGKGCEGRFDPWLPNPLVADTIQDTSLSKNYPRKSPFFMGKSPFLGSYTIQVYPRYWGQLQLGNPMNQYQGRTKCFWMLKWWCSVENLKVGSIGLIARNLRGVL